MPPFQEVCTQCDSHTYTTKAPVEWVDYNRKMLCQLFQNGDTKEYKLLAGPNGKCVAGGKETEIPNLIVAVKKKPSAPLKEQAVEEEEKEDEEEKGVSLRQEPSCAPKASLAKRRKIEKDDSADPPVDPPVEEQEENEEEDEEDNVHQEEEDWEEECVLLSNKDVKVVAVGKGKEKPKGNREKGWTYMWYKNGHTIGIRQKHGEKRQIFSFGGKRFASDFSEGRLRVIAQSVIHKLEQGILKESTANAWVQNEYFS